MLNKLNKLGTLFQLLLKEPKLLLKILEADERWKFYSQNNGYPPALPVIDIQHLLPRAELSLNTYSFLDGGSLITDLLLLKALAKRFDDCTYFEIGTWRGESVCNVADVAKACYTLNLPSEEMRAFGLSESYIDQYAFFSKDTPNIIHLEGNSKHFDFSSLGKQFDLIFIDGDHHYEMVKNDTEKVFAHLVHENSIVVWHDYAFSPEKIRYEVLSGIWEGIPEELRTHLYHVSNTKCAIFTRDSFPTRAFKAYENPKLRFKVSTNLNPMPPSETGSNR